MSVVFRAMDAPIATREDYWRQIISEHIGQIDVHLDDGPGIEDRLVVGELGAVRIADSSTGPGVAVRNHRHVRQADPDGFQLIVQTHGRAIVGHDDDLSELAPGDLSLVDASRPFRCIHQSKRAILLTFPVSLMPLRRADVAQLAGTPIPGGSGLPALFSTFARQLAHLDDDPGVVGARLGSAVIDLLTVTLAVRLEHESAVPSYTHRRTLLARIHGFIEARLGDPELTPSAVAAANHISVRYLHRLFEMHGRSVATVIRQRRLERCRQDLLDPALAGRSVAATAAHWGFSNAAHFTRIFREAYGLPPGEFRLQHLKATA